MKTSTKLMAAALFVAAIFIGNNVNAQMVTSPNPWRFGIGVEGGIPTGNLHSPSKLELGGTARLQYGFGGNYAVMLTSGFYNVFFKDNAGTTTTIGKSTYLATHDQGIIPVKLGIKDFFLPSFYFTLESGAGFETRYNQDTKLILSYGFGYASKSVDLGVRYENFSGQSNTYGLVGLRLAYGFGL